MNSNLNSSPIPGFSALLYYHFIIKKRYRVSDVAKEMRIADDTLYRYIRGENVMPPDRVVDLILATHEVEFLEFYTEPCGYAAVPIGRVKPSGETYEKDSIVLTLNNADVLRAIDKALKDGKIDRLDARIIERALTRLITKAAEMKEKLKKEVAR